MARVALFTVYDNFALGIRLLGSYLEKHGHESHLLFLKKYSIKKIKYPRENPSNYEYTDIGQFFGTGYDVDPWTDNEVEMLYTKLKSLNPDIIGLSTRSFIEDRLLEILCQLRKRFPRSILLCGGFGPTFKPDLYLQKCDYVIIGEGEEVLLEIANAVDSGRQSDIISFDNIVYRKDGKLVRNRLRPIIRNFSEFPFPKVGKKEIYHIDDDKIVESDDFRGVYNIFWGRGCLNKCSYCCAGQWSSLYKESDRTPIPYRRREIEDLVSELKIAKQLGFRNISFVDSYFGASYEIQKQFLLRYKQEINLPFFAHFHPEMIIAHPDLIETAYECGLHSTVVGVQSGSERFAKEVFNRKNNNKSLLEFARILSRQKNLKIQYHFIIGNPLETKQSFEETLCFIKQLSDDPEIRINTVGVHRLKLFPGTPLSEQVKKAGVLSSTLQDWVYQSQMAHLRLWTGDAIFSYIYQNKRYRFDTERLVLICRLIGFPVHLKRKITRFANRVKDGRYSEIFGNTQKRFSGLLKKKNKTYQT